MSQKTIHVLHVDDEPGFADLTETFLEREEDQFTVETATSATDGVEIIDDRPPDCIVSDYDMPTMDGIEFLRTVRSEYPDLPFILFTGRGSEEVASDAISAGATDYLQKGSGNEQYRLLANRILNSVKQYRSERQLRETQAEYSAVFENLHDALLLVEIEEDGFRYQQCNPRAVELIGRDRAEIIGNTPRKALGPENGKKVTGAYRKCVEQGSPIEYTVTLDLPTGNVTRECQAAPIPTDGEIVQLVVSFQDITERRKRQQEFEEEQRFVQQSLNTLNDLFYVVDTDRKLQRWNDYVLELTGYSESDLKGTDISEFFPDDEVDKIVHAVEGTLNTGNATVEADLLTSDGRRIPHEFRGQHLTDSDGKTTGIVGIGRDLTERRQRERRFQALVQEADDVISIVDAEGRFQYQSPSVERILGYDSDETIGDSAWEYIHPEDREKVKKQFEDWLARPTDTTGQIEYRARHADGSWRWMEARGNNQFSNPAVEGFVINSRNVSDRRERQLKLEQIETLFEHAQDALFLIDLTDNFTVERVNPAWETMTGIPAEHALGKAPSEILNEAAKERTEAKYRQCIERQEPLSYEEVIEFGERETYWRTKIAPVVINDTVEYLVGSTRNITERKKREQELKEYESVIRALSDAVYVLDDDGQFTYINDEFVELVGYDREQILGSGPALIKSEDAVNQAERQLGRLLSDDGPEAVKFEVMIQPREGDPIVCEDHMGIIPYEGENFDGSVGTLRDITEYREERSRLGQLN
jgi:PAS domain S-box-containing protein